MRDAQRTPPPETEVNELWARTARPLSEVPEVAEAWAARKIDVAQVEKLKLARALPSGAGVPAWARSWASHRLIVPMYDAAGRLASLHARRPATDPKALSPTGHAIKGLVFANPLGLLMLEGKPFGEKAAHRELAIVEGVPDFLTLATRGRAVLGVISGSWNATVAKRVPSGARVLVATHGDGPGNKYAEQIRKSLGRRCEVLRKAADWNDLLQAGELPEDPFRDAASLAAPADEELTPREGETTAEGSEVLKAACEKIRTAPERAANLTLNREGFIVYQHVAGGEIDEEEATAQLTAAALDRGMPKGEIKSTLRSARKGMESPRTGGIRKLAAEHVFVAEQGRYFNTITGGVFRPEALDTKYCRDVRASGRKKRFTDLINPHMGRADDFGFYPGKAQIFEWKGKTLVNTWRDPAPVPEKSPPPTLWLKHLAYLLSDKAEREHLLDVLAHNVQHLDGKVNHAIVLGGTRGIGKDMLFKPLAKWLDRAWRSTSLEELAGQFSSYQKGAKVVFVEEARQQSVRDATALYNKLKNRISEDATAEVKVHEKFLNPYEIPNVAQWIFTTNYRDGVFFEDKDDRGHFVIWSPAAPKEPVYYGELSAYIDAHYLDVIGHLKRRDISAFNSKAPPPHTAAREEMYAATRSNAEAALARIVEEVAGAQAVFSMIEIKDKARRLEDFRPVMQLLEGNHAAQVGRVFRDARCHSDRIKIEEKRVTVYWRGTMEKGEAAAWYRQHLKVWKAQSPGGGN
jgi:hypothetical protein